jgi:hypothetical protein
MSILALPRVHFRGGFVTNVCTANNDKPQLSYVDKSAVSVDTGGRSDADFRSFLHAFDPALGDIRGGWNPFGDNGCNFLNVTVTAVELPDGQVLTSAADDPLVGAAVHLGARAHNNTAVMVDVDPEGTFGTQIFSDELRVQAGPTTLWKGAPSVLYSRWLNFQRNLGVGRSFAAGSAVWQAGVPLDALTFGSVPSRGLDALRQAGVRGLLMRFCTYLFAPGIPSNTLAQQFAAGQTTVNPASGVVVGTIGGWDADDRLATAPTGRRLDPSADLILGHTQYRLGPALARVDHSRRVVSLDLISTFPEQDTTLVKVDPGPCSLGVLVPGETEPRRIGGFDHDRAAYERTSGVVDVPIPSGVEAFVDQGQLVVRLDNSDLVVLREKALDLETDERGIYLQEGGAVTIGIQATSKGAAPASALTVKIEQYVTTDGAAGDTPAPADGGVVTVVDHVQTDQTTGRAELTLRGRTFGTCLLRFVAPGAQPGQAPRGLDSFANVRVLPRDDFSTVPDDDLTFAVVYDTVLRYYYLLYPTMDRLIDLSSEDDVRANADVLLERIAEDGWRGWEYMPRTRELSDGKRALLERWLRMQLA